VHPTAVVRESGFGDGYHGPVMPKVNGAHSLPAWAILEFTCSLPSSLGQQNRNIFTFLFTAILLLYICLTHMKTAAVVIMQ